MNTTHGWWPKLDKAVGVWVDGPHHTPEGGGFRTTCSAHITLTHTTTHMFVVSSLQGKMVLVIALQFTIT